MAKTKIYFPDDETIENEIFNRGYASKPILTTSLRLAISNLVVIEQLIEKIEELEAKLSEKN